jgi:transcriptional regulator with XRE-family HTH domain
VTPTAFGLLLRRLREDRLLSQRALAERAAVSKAHLAHLEWGKQRRPSRAVVAALAAGLGLDGADTCRLLIAAGYWPWRLPDAAIAVFVAAVEDASAAGGEDWSGA